MKKSRARAARHARQQIKREYPGSFTTLMNLSAEEKTARAVLCMGTICRELRFREAWIPVFAGFIQKGPKRRNGQTEEERDQEHARWLALFLLTEAETRLVLKILKEHFSQAKSIARDLGVTPRTVSFHIANVMNRTKSFDKTDLILGYFEFFNAWYTTHEPKI